MNRALERLISTGLRGRLLAQSARFVAYEVSGSHAVRSYRLRGADVWMYLQHNTPDVLVVDEIFYQRLYELPPEVSDVLPAAPRVLDAGANIGLFGVWALARLPGSEILSFEPDARNASLLRDTVRKNRAEERWRVTEAALSTRVETVGFAGGDFATSHVVADGGAHSVAALDLFEQAADADLVKLDIEGSEWEILADTRMDNLRASALVLEYHPANSPDEDTHAAAAALLARAGYATKPIFRAASGVGMLWAWRTKR
jgi:FkbM family methyltransferase